ncbi:translesion DNA synthesis-associated protein ImuA [Arenimonas caeni]|uniref:DNA lesion error-prone repair protein ImuA n=1 Tax=Arenimonas caeni TaxID=2058085 RepID=A0A2P6MC95_9GAMM|nr:translesion DNA synthesis-associated protein ImuA [Arenimonas caeni]PRH83623.1 DNA lesion error-prone repair protein ImuA [Arenimonas caeni]
MGAVLSLDTLLAQRRLWRGQPGGRAEAAREPTGHAALDAALPGGGWPEAALTELLLPADGVGELALLLPTLARLTRAGRDIAWVDPPYRPYAPALARAGLDLARLHVVDTGGRQSAWALEQCLRSQACGAVLGWPRQADDKTLRRLQVACETGQALGFVFRPLSAARNASPAALRLQLETGGVRVLKCRGSHPPASPVPWAPALAH